MNEPATNLRESPGNPPLRGVVSGACACKACTDRTTSIYRMVGRCFNCWAHVLMLFRAGDKARPLDCPVCGCWRQVHADRLATDDEIPESVIS